MIYHLLFLVTIGAELNKYQNNYYASFVLLYILLHHLHFNAEMIHKGNDSIIHVF